MPTNSDLNDGLRARSGAVDLDGRLVAFLYALLRDHVQPGVAEALVRETELDPSGPHHYSNGWLARYAEDLAGRLLTKTP